MWKSRVFRFFQGYAYHYLAPVQISSHWDNRKCLNVLLPQSVSQSVTHSLTYSFIYMIYILIILTQTNQTYCIELFHVSKHFYINIFPYFSSTSIGSISSKEHDAKSFYLFLFVGSWSQSIGCWCQCQHLLFPFVN